MENKIVSRVFLVSAPATKRTIRAALEYTDPHFSSTGLEMHYPGYQAYFFLNVDADKDPRAIAWEYTAKLGARVTWEGDMKNTHELSLEDQDKKFAEYVRTYPEQFVTR